MVTVTALTAILLVAAALLVATVIVAVIAAVLVHRRVPIEPPPAVTPAEPLATGRTPRLLPQFTAGVRGSRAPPAASA